MARPAWNFSCSGGEKLFLELATGDGALCRLSGRVQSDDGIANLSSDLRLDLRKTQALLMQLNLIRTKVGLRHPVLNWEVELETE